jgi:hypothetical protein
VGEELGEISSLQLLIRLAAYLLPLEFVEKSWYKDFIMLKWTIAPDSNGPEHRVHMYFGRDETGSVYLPTQLERYFTGEGKCNERGWACTPHPHQPGLISPSSLNVRPKAAVATRK